MRNSVLKKGLVVGMILLFIGTSIPVSNATIKESSEESEIINEGFEKYTELFNEGVQKNINQALFERIGVFLIFSSGLGYTNFFPVLFMYDKICPCFVASIDYTSIGSLTRIRKIGDGIVDSAFGPHELFFVGIGLIHIRSRGFFLPDSINFVGISFTKPIIK